MGSGVAQVCALAVMEVFERDFDDPKHLGRKCSRGFYTYS